MSQSVLHIVDQRFVLAALTQDQLGDVDVLALVVAADVVDLAGNAFMEGKIDSAAVVFYVQPISDIQSITVHGN